MKKLSETQEVLIRLSEKKNGSTNIYIFNKKNKNFENLKTHCFYP